MRKKKKKASKATPQPEFPPEDRRAEAVTVAWMLCALFALCAEIVGLGARIALSSIPEAEEPPRWIALPFIATGIAWVAGTLALLLTPVVYRLRTSPPPEMITLFVLLIGLAPPMLLALQWWRG